MFAEPQLRRDEMETSWGRETDSETARFTCPMSHLLGKHLPEFLVVWETGEAGLWVQSPPSNYEVHWDAVTEQSKRQLPNLDSERDSWPSERSFCFFLCEHQTERGVNASTWHFVASR